MTQTQPRRFGTSWRGYERTQVNIYLDRVEKGRRPSQPLPNAPDFTIVLRGYDRDEVDKYLAGMALPSPSLTVQGEYGDGVPTLLREVADSIEERGNEVVDLVLNFSVNDTGTRHSMTVYFGPEDDTPDDTP